MTDIKLSDVLAAAQLAGANMPAFQALLRQVQVLFSSADQATLQAALEDAQAANDAGHARLQAKLAAAAAAEDREAQGE